MRSSSGDPVRTLALLWRDPAAVPRRGPTRRLDIDAVVASAIRLADEHGLDAVTMRAVATAANTAPMTLYTYVPGKAELLDLMLDTIYAAMPRTHITGRVWRRRATVVANENLALHIAHPWTLDISTLRPTLGPGAIGKYEQELAAFDGLGLTDVQIDDCLTYLLNFVRATVRTSMEAATNLRESRLDDTAWWATVGPQLARYLDPAGYPLASRVGTAAGAAHGSAHEPRHAYQFGLARTLDGLATLIDGKAQAQGKLVQRRGSGARN
jgi:AcrR family transcriptional regulator